MCSCWSSSSGSRQARRPAPAGQPPATRGGSRERRSQDPGRQHLRRERRPRRHRGLAHRSDWAVLVRHEVPLQVGPDRERPAPQPPLGGRPPVLRDPVLPRAGDGDRLHRRQAVGHPRARRGRRLPRGAHRDEPRRDARGPGATHRGGLRLRRPLRGQGRAAEEGRLLHARRGRQAGPRLQPRDLRARDLDLGLGGLLGRRSRPDLQGPRRAARAVDDRPGRGHRAWRAWHQRGATQVRPPGQEGPAQHGAQPREVARRGPPARLRLGPTQADLPSQPRRSCRPALLTGRAAGPLPAGRRAAVVHDHVRPRQHLHQPPGAALRARSGAHHAGRARDSGRGRAATTSATRTRAGSCTSCASGR